MPLEPTTYEHLFMSGRLDVLRDSVSHDRLVAIAKANPQLGLKVEERPASKYVSGTVEECDGVRYLVLRSEHGLLECYVSEANDEGGQRFRPIALSDVPEVITFGDAS